MVGKRARCLSTRRASEGAVCRSGRARRGAERRRDTSGGWGAAAHLRQRSERRRAVVPQVLQAVQAEGPQLRQRPQLCQATRCQPRAARQAEAREALQARGPAEAQRERGREFQMQQTAGHELQPHEGRVGGARQQQLQRLGLPAGRSAART
jgi:hypothetical protein